MVTADGGIAQRLMRPLAALGLVIAFGTAGYHFLERMSVTDSLYMAVITVTTVGFREVRDLDPPGRVFTIVLILFGVGAFMYTATAVANYVIAGELRGFMGQRRMEKQIERLHDHYIVCGYGRMGRRVAAEFRRESKPLVVVDLDAANIDLAMTNGYLALLGDAGDDTVLKRAGVERARGLVAGMADDAVNLMVVLSARALNDNLFIIARANKDATESKLITAGANRVLLPYGLAGRRIAQMALRPNVVEFLEVVMHDEELELWMEEMVVAIESRLDGCAIGASAIRQVTGVNVVALRQRTGKLIAAPTPDTVLSAGDILVVVGTREQLARLAGMSRT